MKLKVTSIKPYIRSYQPGDDELLVALWERAHTNYGGYIVKTPEYWRWCVLNRPGVGSENIVIFEVENNVIAYGALEQISSSSGQQGNVLEFAVEPQLSSREKKKLASKLITALEEKSRMRGDQVLNVALPTMDKPIIRAIQKAGYKAEVSDSFQLVIVDTVDLLRQILHQRLSTSSNKQSPSFALSIEPGYYHFCPHKHIRIQLSSPPVVDQFVVDCDYNVTIELSLLTDIIFRRETFENALQSNKIAITPATGVQQVRELFQLLVLRSDWYVPIADDR